ncbi:hypothetical protein BKK79_32740 [Cupriavidus sp. USMAA2-4]|uniref:four-carbon acid sugar kinase family protein n=1 Tax=Cupriavidus sp. USMAA2-4 TaxID=876364 RepID=UPI0008A6CEFB|nr:four-carbon acid sugar kinase family protein [Cupriavidus sp. USMAA2-4]AOY96361.1 hypothetical protein BKK79_32740 [Cupriavidus sp. USMAA2-4]
MNAPAIRARLLIVADDLSGAADCAVAGTRLGLRSAVLLHAGAACPAGQDVLAVDADSRRAAPAEAARRQLDAWQALAGAGTRLYKKVDSTLRGNAAAEIAALVPLAGLAIVAPAYPATGRTTRDGRQWLHGVAVEKTEVWRNEGIPGRADLGAMLRAQGLRTALLPLEAIRAGRPALAARFAALQAEGIQAVVCDALGEDDLAHIATASAALQRVFWAGSGGLAPALMQALGLDRRAGEGADGGADGGAEDTDGHDADDHDGAGAAAGTDAGIVPGPVLTVVGSMSSISHTQAARLRDAAGDALLAFEVPVDGPDEAVAPLGQAVAAALRARRDVLVTLSQATRADPADGLRHCRRLATLLAPGLPLAGALVATGGETARALLAAAGIEALRIAEEVEPGMPLLHAARAGAPLAVVTKAGGFGTPGSLHAAWKRLSAATPVDAPRAPIRTKETLQ